MNLPQATVLFARAVEADPTRMYNRIKKMYGNDFRNVTPGFEHNPQVKRQMVEYLTEKARLSGDIGRYVASV
jgi:hypothetical protein